MDELNNEKWQQMLIDFHLSPFESLSADTVAAIADKKRMRELATALKREMGMKLAMMFATDDSVAEAMDKAVCEGDVVSASIWYLFSDRRQGRLFMLKVALEAPSFEYDTLGDICPTALFYEREIHDLFGFKASGHPALKPMVRHSNWPLSGYPLLKSYSASKRLPFENHPVPFATVAGEGVFEVPVGPVHAGIIEPGHFRFSVAGEPIINLEAQLYYVHKGLEKLAEGADQLRGLLLSERVSGDETLANSLAYSQALEKITGIEVPKKAQLVRVFFAELERLTAHFGDLAGICLDVAYGFAAFQFRMLRGWTYFLADEVCSHRFLRNVVVPGGLRKDFLTGKEDKTLQDLAKIEKELRETAQIIHGKASFIDRIENTGVLDPKVAQDLYATGPAGRASGTAYDVRKTFAYAAYGDLDFKVADHHNGDVNCRLHVKIEEAEQSIRLMVQVVELLKKMGPDEPYQIKLPEPKPGSWAVGYAESPRGENLHFVMMGEGGRISRYKVRTASFCNWPAVCHAVRGNIVPDFPLINKSFNLSYAGNDL